MPLVNFKKYFHEHPSKKYQKMISQKLKKGYFVNLSNGKEHFWVKIISLNKKITGIIMNELLDNSRYKLNDNITFKLENIYDIRSNFYS